ncbi:polysaccharide biosynthesis protein [Methanobacterium lacus]|uniref:Polysaccharide biosynthesis protein n=1 Tax=Methanobacterium lacus (strain AL-21) TaxID=877455 RepID=F0T719_METLA|nr:flippase [Methanobacterium lacus]ADZ09539.1 polysaccharide biosynthesis protein [Methanobacterium lacus]
MSSVQRLAKNTTLLFVSQMISYILGFFITMYSARYLGTAGFGVLSTALSLAYIFAVFTDLGLSTIITREVSRDKSLQTKYFTNTTILRLGLALLTFVLVVLFVNIVNLVHHQYPPQTVLVIYIIVASIIFNGLSGTFTAIFQALQKMEYQSISLILNSVLMLIGTIVVIYFNKDILFFALLYVIANVACLIFILSVYFWKYSLPKWDFDLNFIKITLIAALPLSIVSIFTLIAFRVDTVLLSLLKSSVDVGIYSAPYRLFEAFLFLPAAFTISVFPIFSQFFISSNDSLKFTYQKSFKYLTILSLPIAVGVTLLAEPIILLIYKSSFLQSVIVLQILIWTVPITFLNYIFGSILPAMNRQTTLLKITFISMIFNIVLNLWAIPHYSYIGASIVTVLTEIIVIILCFFVLSKSFCSVNLKNVIFKPAVASAVMACFILTVNINLFLEIIISIIIYFAVILLIQTFDREDHDILAQIIPIDRFKFLDRFFK